MKTKELKFLEDLEEALEEDITSLRDRLKEIRNRKKELGREEKADLDTVFKSMNEFNQKFSKMLRTYNVRRALAMANTFKCKNCRNFSDGWCVFLNKKTSADNICDDFKERVYLRKG